MNVHFVAPMVTLACIGCIAGNERGYPLYPDAKVLRDRCEVAELSGYIQAVDSADVSEHGNKFELLPGCHVVATVTSWGLGAGSRGLFKTRRLTYAMPMKAGYRYSVGFKQWMKGGRSMSLIVEVTEKDAAGRLTQVFAPAKYQELETCRGHG